MSCSRWHRVRLTCYREYANARSTAWPPSVCGSFRRSALVAKLSPGGVRGQDAERLIVAVFPRWSEFDVTDLHVELGQSGPNHAGRELAAGIGADNEGNSNRFKLSNKRLSAVFFTPARIRRRNSARCSKIINRQKSNPIMQRLLVYRKKTKKLR